MVQAELIEIQEHSWLRDTDPGKPYNHEDYGYVILIEEEDVTIVQPSLYLGPIGIPTLRNYK